MGSPRNITDQTKKKLFALSGNQCAFPGCSVTFYSLSEETVGIVNICHIEDAKPGGRYNDKMTDEERASYDNLILLCQNHHAETNDTSKYSVEALRTMKSEHESKALNMGLQRRPSMLGNAIDAISRIDLPEPSGPENQRAVDPTEKLSYNSLKSKRQLIQELKVYSYRVSLLYDELEAQGSIKKNKLLDNIRVMYLEVIGRYVNDSPDRIGIIRENSDKIFEDVYDEMLSRVTGMPQLKEEDLELGLKLIMVDAFLRCKILEEPQ